jgi:hypothetical protein
MDSKKAVLKGIEKRCKNAIFVKAKHTLHFNEDTLYCKLKNPVIMSSGHYTDDGICDGIIRLQKELGKYEVNIDEEKVSSCQDKDKDYC